MGRALLGVVLLGTVGCTYSPPIRGLHPGMPGRLARGQLEVGGVAGGVGIVGGSSGTAPTTGGPHLAYGLSDGLVVEGGANLNFFEGGWATAYAGVRLSRSRPLPDELTLVGELELGAGLGLGGHRYPPPSTRWTQWQAWGLYEGLAVGLRWRWLGGYLRGRLDASASNDWVASLWPSAMVGLEARAGAHVVFGAGAGLVGEWTQGHGLVGIWFYQAQVAFLFDLAPRR